MTAAPSARFKPYAAYKDSGVEWLGEIPEHWQLMALKRLISFTTGWTPPTGQQRYYKGDHFWANIGDLGPQILCVTQKTISDEAIRESRMKPSPPGALLFAFKLSVGAVSIAGGSMYTNEAIATFLPGAALDVMFLYWAAPVYVPRNAVENIYGAQLLSRERIANAWLCAPPTGEQRAIAAFLDWETARIDALVAKKERLIALLLEKRTALITRAVTKGLDPNVPMKDSGVEWLGEIPAHWNVSKLKCAASRIVDCPHETPTYSDDGEHHVVRTADVSAGRLDLSAARRVDATEFRLRVRRLALVADDIVYSREGERFGHAALVPCGVSACLGQRMMQFRPGPGWLPRFLMWQLNAQPVYQQACLDTTGATSPHVNVETIRNFWLSQPPLAEQRGIAEFVDHETARIDALVAKVREATDRLKELRTALIAATVTGKIDVRDAGPA